MSDANLIQGARDVAQARARQDAQMNDMQTLGWAMQELAEELKGNISLRKQQSGDHTENAQKFLDNGGQLSPAELDAIRNEVGGQMLDDYDKASQQKPLDQKVMTSKLAEVSSGGAQIKNYQDFLTGLATKSITGKLSKGFTEHNPFGQQILGFLNNSESHLVKNKCPEGVEDCENKNEWGVNLPDLELIQEAQNELGIVEEQIAMLEKEYKPGNTMPEGMEELYQRAQLLQATIESNPVKFNSLQTLAGFVKNVDSSSSSMIKNAAELTYKKAYESTDESQGTFDRAFSKRNMWNNVISKGDFESILYDPMLDRQESFYDDFQKMIRGPIGMEAEAGGWTYRDLGVTEEQLLGADKNLDDEIDAEEAKIIADTIIKDKTTNREGRTMIQDYVTNYFVNHLEKQHVRGWTDRDVKNSKEKEEKQERQLDRLADVQSKIKEKQQEQQDNALVDEVINKSQGKEKDEEEEYEPQSQRNTDYA